MLITEINTRDPEDGLIKGRRKDGTEAERGRNLGFGFCPGRVGWGEINYASAQKKEEGNKKGSL